ncbi:hypothetical protein SAMN05216360_10391 [Methylobacterium phyllostachyos]|uniref:Uncharacterized protein n=1 Tax=Methylobacterium phyllostachyos TaxID=582672 RepID=A0A1G9V775_9HYPH|nr:hypothetical protein [Methylobacterium phyllostachyos]SDM67950.1 hypothetical protein SAMN05216360_10391 [Methylobacterium phyllostachyos]
MRRVLTLAAVVGLAVALGGCPDKAALDLTGRAALPPVPADLEACIHRTFPEIPARAFGRREAVGIIADAKLLDRAKTACGERALLWMNAVTAEFGRSTL